MEAGEVGDEEAAAADFAQQQATSKLMRERAVKRALYLAMFRAIVRKVILQKFWQEMFDTKTDELEKRTTDSVYRRIGRKEILFQKEKNVLSIPFNERDSIQEKIAKLIVIKMKCMDKFHPKLRQTLAKFLRYANYCQGRTVIKEGYEPQVLYFILSGEISVLKCQWNVQLLKKIDCVVSVMGPGEMFGHLGLMSDEPRTNTFKTATACELLYILKEDFDEVLKPTLTAHLKDVRTALARFEYFRGWSQSQLDECTLLAKIVEFKPEEVIYAEDRGLLNFVFFVLSGQCEIIQHMRIKTYQKNNTTRYKLEEFTPTRRQSRFLQEPPLEQPTTKDSSKTGKPSKTIKFFVNIGQYNSRSVFGLGEQLEERLVMAKTKVQCLMLPRYWLFQKQQNVGNIWNRTLLFLNSTIPSREALFHQFLTNRKWKAFKGRIVSDVAQRTTKKTTTTLLDVPIICRIENGL